MNKKDITIVICCAGMGKRLEISTAKALLNIDGKPLILRQLELLDDYDDVRVVVGYNAEKVISTVLEYRKDVMFVFNYDYDKTSIVTSLNKAVISPRKYVVQIDGDILIHPNDLKRIIEYPHECITGNKVHSEQPIFLDIKDDKVVGFTKESGKYEWAGISKLKSDKKLKEKEYMYMSLEEYLPMDFVGIQAIDIDTVNDYIKAVDWFKEVKKEVM